MSGPKGRPACRTRCQLGAGLCAPVVLHHHRGDRKSASILQKLMDENKNSIDTARNRLNKGRFFLGSDLPQSRADCYSSLYVWILYNFYNRILETEKRMKFCVVGINHHIAPIALREKVHFKETDIIACSEQITGEGIEECIIVSTCNRSEIYFMSRDVIADCGRIKQFYQSYFQTPIEDAFFIEKVSDDAIRHLFYVSVGLDSAVVGEDQILGQVVDAQETAINIGSTGKGINKIFREAITFSKEVKTQTNVSHTPVSIAYIGVKQIARFVDLKTARVLVSGLGNMGRLAAVHLMDSGAEVFVTNRTIENSYKSARAPGRTGSAV